MYRRYIDDGMGVKDMPLYNLENCISFFLSFHRSIQLTTSMSTSSLNLLDVTVSGPTLPLNIGLLWDNQHPRISIILPPPTRHFVRTLFISLNCYASCVYAKIMMSMHRALEMLDFFLDSRVYQERVLSSPFRRYQNICCADAFTLNPKHRPLDPYVP